MRATGPVLLAASYPASANTIEGLGGLAGGLLHPVLTPTHALALLGLALLIGQQPPGKRALPQLLFALALAAGLLALALAVGETPAGTVLLGGAAISGVLVATALRLPLLLLSPLAAVVGTSIGLDSPPEVISLQEAVLMLIGTGLGATIGLALLARSACGCWAHGRRRARCWRSRCGSRNKPPRYSAATRLVCSFAARSMAAAR
jgi:hydrogenase/urease accessory protein HupE